MSIHKEKLSFLCFLRSSISDRFNFSAISSLHECTQQSLIFQPSFNSSSQQTTHNKCLNQRVMGVFHVGSHLLYGCL